MLAAVIPIGRETAKENAQESPKENKDKRPGNWSLVRIAPPGQAPVPFGILFFDEADDRLTFRLRDPDCLGELDEPEADILAALADDLERKGREMGGRGLIGLLEDTASHFFRIGERNALHYAGAPEAVVDRLFNEHVLGTGEDRASFDNDADRVIPFVTHLPLYGLRAAATKFGESMEAVAEGWVRAPARLRLTEGMFVAKVVGRSMEPRIPDGSLCIFRAPVTGSRQGRLVLIEKLDETDFAGRFTVKRYAVHGARDESAERTEKIRLEPINKEFEAFYLEADRFRVIAEFVQVLTP
jgi:SOS-response transcriptional repressor LexA